MPCATAPLSPPPWPGSITTATGPRTSGVPASSHHRHAGHGPPRALQHNPQTTVPDAAPVPTPDRGRGTPRRTRRRVERRRRPGSGGGAEAAHLTFRLPDRPRRGVVRRRLGVRLFAPGKRSRRLQPLRFQQRPKFVFGQRPESDGCTGRSLPAPPLRPRPLRAARGGIFPRVSPSANLSRPPRPPTRGIPPSRRPAPVAWRQPNPRPFVVAREETLHLLGRGARPAQRGVFLTRLGKRRAVRLDRAVVVDRA